MEKRLKRIEIAVVILLLLSVINLVGPQINFSSQDTAEIPTEVPDLPEDLTREFLDQTVYQIKTTYNRSDWEEFFQIYGEWARANFCFK